MIIKDFSFLKMENLFSKFGISLAIFLIVLFSCDKNGKILVSIEITTQPTRKTYFAGDAFVVDESAVGGEVLDEELVCEL